VDLRKNLVSSLAKDSLVTVIDSLLYISTLQRRYKNLSLAHLLCALSLVLLLCVALLLWIRDHSLHIY
jgi:hypothetical protein